MLTVEFARRNRKWTQTQLSQVTHIAQPLISLIERRGRATPEQLERLALALDIAPDLLLQPVDLVGEEVAR